MLVAQGDVWTLLSSAFTHLDLFHIGLNMLALYVLGPRLEVLLGRARFLALYLVSALAGSALVMWASPPFGATLGASGAVFGLFGAYLVVALRVKADLQPILTVIGINLLFTVVGRSFISWQGHLGGFVGGLLVALVLVYAPRSGRARWQWLGVTGVLARGRRRDPGPDGRPGLSPTAVPPQLWTHRWITTPVLFTPWCTGVDNPGARPGGAGRYSQRVAKTKPTAMAATPTNRLRWPRSLKIGSTETSSLIT